MRRREILLGLLGGSAWLAGLELRRALAETPEERAEAWRREAIDGFPFELVETSGRDALSTWETLRGEGRGSPVVLGAEEDLARVAEQRLYFSTEGQESPEDLLKKTEGLEHPEGLRSFIKLERARSKALLLRLRDQEPNPSAGGLTITGPEGTRHLSFEEAIDYFLETMEEDPEPEIGRWPNRPAVSAGLSVARETISDRPFDKVYIAVLPTEDSTTIPIHLRWGNWNACPPPEYHVAALRSWRDRYGAELVGLSGDVMNLRVARRPGTRAEALALAREHYDYCNDVVDQGLGTLSRLAASLMADDWWFFWWD